MKHYPSTIKSHNKAPFEISPTVRKRKQLTRMIPSMKHLNSTSSLSSAMGVAAACNPRELEHTVDQIAQAASLVRTRKFETFVCLIWRCKKSSDALCYESWWDKILTMTSDNKTSDITFLFRIKVQICFEENHACE